MNLHIYQQGPTNATSHTYISDSYHTSSKGLVCQNRELNKKVQRKDDVVSKLQLHLKWFELWLYIYSFYQLICVANYNL